MKTLLFLVGAPLLIGAALAQTTTPQDNNSQNSSSTSQNATTATQSNSTTTTTTGTTMAEMKTQSYKGTLVDAACAAPGASKTSEMNTGSSSSTATASSSSSDTAAASADRATASGTKATSDMGQSNTADRSASPDQAQSCPVSANTSQFGLKMNDGRTVRFDSVGNQRAQEALKNKKKWTTASTSGKPIHAKVSGVLSGDKLTVMSID